MKFIIKLKRKKRTFKILFFFTNRVLFSFSHLSSPFTTGHVFCAKKEGSLLKLPFALSFLLTAKPVPVIRIIIIQSLDFILCTGDLHQNIYKFPFRSFKSWMPGIVIVGVAVVPPNIRSFIVRIPVSFSKIGASAIYSVKTTVIVFICLSFLINIIPLSLPPDKRSDFQCDVHQSQSAFLCSLLP